MQNRFEDQLLEALDGEVGSEDCGSHLTRRELRRLARGRTRASDLERQGGHLACCAECRTRYDDVRRDLASTLPSTAESGVRRGWNWARVVYRHAGIGALALSILALVLVLGPRGPSTTPLAALRAAPDGARGVGLAAAPDLNASSLVQELHALDGYPTNRAAAAAMEIMARYGVPMSSPALRSAHPDLYFAREGDSWESVAEATQGDPALWPIIVLWNLELTSDGSFVPPGQPVRVPRAVDAETRP